MLKGKSALVTGSTSGIRQGIAEALTAAGEHSVLNELASARGIEGLRAKITRAYGLSVRYESVDMIKLDAVKTIVNKAVAEFGAIDNLLNNDGIQYVALIDELPVNKWNAIIAIKLTASCHTIRRALPIMQANGSGRIVNIVSAHALVASPFRSTYVPAKHGVAGLIKTVARKVNQARLHNECDLSGVRADATRQKADSGNGEGVWNHGGLRNQLISMMNARI